MNATHFTTPGGEELVFLTKSDFDRLCDKADALDHARALHEIATGNQDTLTAEEVKQALSEPTPLAFWRKKRGLTQAELAGRSAISQSYLASLETGKRRGEPQLFLRLATALGVRMEDLV